MEEHRAQIALGQRFQFGSNWARFLSLPLDDRIRTAENSLLQMMEVSSIANARFLDIGSGSGLFSLAARRLGARVHSFDFDPESVRYTAELKRRYFPDDDAWTVEEGSALDEQYLRSLGQFDIVYSWGVLHHTGQMWRALDNAVKLVKENGTLFIAIYNDTGTQAKRWRRIKTVYNKLPRAVRPAYAVVVSAPGELKAVARALFAANPRQYVRRWTEYSSRRGMSLWRDVLDWVGGLPYEVATPDEIFEFCKARGFTLTKMKCGNVGLGCNQFVFRRNLPLSPAHIPDDIPA